VNPAPQLPLPLPDLERLAIEMRMDIIRMLHGAASGHPGGSLSAIDLVANVMFNHIRRTPDNALAPDRDRFVLSKGHGVPALYAVLGKLGLIDPGEFATLRRLNSRLQGHPHNGSLPYVEASTGSLGQGLSIAQGMALAARLQGWASTTYCLIGDGETQEGQVWETLLSARKFALDTLIVIMDCNKGQIDGATRDVMDLEPLEERLRSFQWDVQRIDGHDYAAIDAALHAARRREGKPHFIIADTIKGKGVSFMENNHEWHGKAPNARETEEALAELQRSLDSIPVRP
jgi:transketolase